MKELQTKPLLRSHNIVVEPQLIKIRALKLKDLDQLKVLHPGWKEEDGEDRRKDMGNRRQRTCQIPDVMEILGDTGGWIIVRYGETSGYGPAIDDRFAKINNVDYAWYLWATAMRNRGLQNGLYGHENLSDGDKARSTDLWNGAERTMDEIPQIFIS